ncbi:hypothetical protein FNO01nite_01380 [Flavobacterium noncentrifugens]|uniref:Uncharacterized protein n=1 Tax=Flavobacterium noncentrifugens TaxID=1128970 RepID=A0A1G8RJZ0_9FLAO|nr:hypothetical protein [Flavobacterium noncentrifugens]GEP49466.1 hypothetical protein FNO01nite_01380 [Flavobacterium noncentrifugens]SDJ17261.1 hypothetical protein SAMN04487935_0157 [Flavobacterium noncentrifugens]
MLLLTACNFYHCYSQEQALQNLYNAFDSTIGYQNLGINNGTIHINNDRSDNKTNRYYLKDSYLPGIAVYDGQVYRESKLKYDLSKDILIVKVYGESNNTGIELIPEKTAGFEIDAKKFVNLSYGTPKLPAFISGFYEVVTGTPELQFYIKHHKEHLESINDRGKFTNYQTQNSFVVCYKNEYRLINSQSDFTRVFPDYLKEIDNFYQINREDKRKDPTQFMRNLLIYTGSLLAKDYKQ